MSRRKKLAYLGLAVSMALPQGLGQFSRLSAGTTSAPGGKDTAPTDSTDGLSNSQLLDRGLDQYRAGQYDDSLATLRQVDPSGLGDGDREVLNQTLAKTQDAANQRQSARSEFEAGETARKAGQIEEARGYYSAVLANIMTDDATRRQARQALAAVDAGLKGNQAAAATNVPADPGRAAYEAGQRAYKLADSSNPDTAATNMATAKASFLKAQQLGYKPGFMQGLTPAQYLARMNELTGSATASAQTVNLGDSTQPSGSPSDVNALQNQAQAEQQEQAQKVYKAKGLVDLGAKAEQAGNLDEALKDYQDAASTDPNNAEAAAKVQELLVKTGRAPAPTGGTALAEHTRMVELERQEITYRFNTAIKDAGTAIQEGRFDDADAHIAEAQAAHDQDPTVFNENEEQSMSTQIEQVKGDLQQSRLNFQQTQSAQSRTQAEQLNIARIEKDKEERAAEVASLIKVAKQQIQDHQYEAALGVLDQILVIAPDNDFALAIRQWVEDQAIFHAQRHLRERGDYETARQLNQAEEDLIPYSDFFVFPENWPDISELRDRELKDTNISKEDQQVQALLDRRLPRVMFNQIALSDAIEFLRDITGANILVDWKALEGAQIDRQVQVTASLHDVKFSKVLNSILDQAGGGKLAYTIGDGVITISTTDELNKAVVTRVYDVSDLLINPNFNSTITTQIQYQGSSGSGGGGGGSSAGGGLFGTGSSTSGEEGGQSQEDIQKQLDDLKAKITKTVDPDSWKDNNANSFGQIDDFNSSLIVTQTPEEHQKVLDLLTQLREVAAVQVTVEARFLSVERNFMEDIGLNLSVLLNGTSQIPAGPLSAIPSGEPYHWSQVAITNQSSSYTSSTNLTTGVPGSIGNSAAGLNTGIAYVDNLVVSLLVTATQASHRSSIVHAPRVTMQSGQGATMLQETFLPYVSSINAVAAAGAAIGTPVISVATDGVELSILRAVVSADHKYVTLDLDPRLDSFLGFVTFNYESGSSGTTTGGLGGVIISDFGAPGLTIQEPREEVTEVRTRVTVPDGGTLLLGGLTVSGEIELEAGVPGLSKIPVINRLTTNTAQAKDASILLILVKPTILINKEIETQQFPLLSTNANP